MIRISQLKLPVGHTKKDLEEKIEKLLHLRAEDLLSYTIQKRSLDARRKPDLFYVYTVEVQAAQEWGQKKRVHNSNITFPDSKPRYSCAAEGSTALTHRPVIIGTGPAGLFCGLQLARMGYCPILLERGSAVEERVQDVAQFWDTGVLKPDSNVQFGEGGAGTFSDGKLNTLVKDPARRNAKVLETFVEFGAPEDILYESKPHIGTDILTMVVKGIRCAIEKAGGEVRFHSKVTDLYTSKSEERELLTGLQVTDTLTGKKVKLDAEIAVLAIGHSARDTFEMLLKRRLPMEAKSFAIGVRVEHPQEQISVSQYGEHYDANLPAAAYKLAVTLENQRGVYTFCMCPGGYVVNASSEEHRLAVNGMSYRDRSGKNANSAVVVTVSPEDYGTDSILSGMKFQRRLEEAAYREGGGKVPVQLFQDFCHNRSSQGAGEVIPQMKGAFRWANVRAIFPSDVAQSLEDGIYAFDRRLKGYARGDAVLSGVESRTSSPVRLLRGESMESKVGGIYPCGEGAGYAGGITSAAMDGLKISEAIAKLYHPFDNSDGGLRNF